MLVWYAAVPFVDRGTLPIWVPPSKKVTVPVGEPLVAGATVAVKVTGEPKLAVVFDDVTATEEPACVTVSVPFTKLNV